MMTAHSDVIAAAAEQGDDVLEMRHLDNGDPDRPGNALVINIEDEAGTALVVRCQIGANGTGVSFIATGFKNGEPCELSPFQLGDQVNLAL